MLLQTDTNKHTGSDGIRNYQWKLKPVGESFMWKMVSIYSQILSLQIILYKGEKTVNYTQNTSQTLFKSIRHYLNNNKM